MKERNFLIGITNGVFNETARNLINPTLILSAFIFEVTGSAILVGFMAAINQIGAFSPQLYVSSLIEHQYNKKPVFIRIFIIRILVLFGMTGIIASSNYSHSTVIIILFLFCFALFRILRGSESIILWDIFSRSIEPYKLGGFIGIRALFSSIASMITGFFIVQTIIANLISPWSYTLLAALAILIMSFDISIFSRFKEVPLENPPQKRNFRETITASFIHMKRSKNYQKLLLLRIINRYIALSLAFFIPYSIQELGITGMSGIYIGTIQAAKLLSSTLWGTVSNKSGNKIVLVFAGLFFSLSAVFALAAGFGGKIYFIILSLICFGTAQQGNQIGFKAFLLESAHPNRKASNLAFLNTITAPVALLAPAVGYFLQGPSANFRIYFIGLLIVSIVSFFVAEQLQEIRKNKIPV